MVAPLAPLAATPWGAIGLGAISAVSSIMGSSAKRRQRRRERAAEDTKYGIQMAGIDFTSARVASFVPSQAKSINDQAMILNAVASKNQAQVEADMRVNAATAGVSGASVDLSLGDTERTLAETQYNIRKNKEDAKRQLEISTADKALNIQMNKGIRIDNEKSSRSTDLLTGGLDFLQAYISKL